MPIMCPICGNYPVREGYRVCASCVEAREHAPHLWEDQPPDEIEDDSEDRDAWDDAGTFYDIYDVFG